MRDPFILDEKLSQFVSSTQDSVLLSSEFLFDEIMQWCDADECGSYPLKLDAVVKKHGFESLSVLLFIRNPISHASSLWQQRIKRHGETRYLADFLNDGAIPYPLLVSRFLDVLEKVPCARVFVRNYSLVSSELLSTVSHWLGAERHLFKLPQISIVNRSLTFGELELQRQLNIEIGISGELLSDRFCQELPNIPADIFPIPLADQKAYWETLATPVLNVNSRINKSQGYQFDQVHDVTDQQSFDLNSKQLAIVARSIKDAVALDSTVALQAALTECGGLRAEREALRGERDALRGERDALLGERDALIDQREAVIRENAVLRERRDIAISKVQELKRWPLKYFCKQFLGKARRLVKRTLSSGAEIPRH